MFKSKRAAGDGGNVAILIILIALFMVLYLLFVPPEVRDDLLGESSSNSGSSSSSSERAELLAESPGILYPTKTQIGVHDIANMNLFLKTQPKVTDLAQNLIIKNSLFSGSSPRIRFSVSSLSDTIKANIFFNVARFDGELRIKVNGNTIYTEEITSSGIKIVEIPKSYLQNNNEIEFSVSSGFFSSNVYALENIGVKQEFQFKNSEELRTFVLSESERKNLESATISYRQYCNEPLENSLTRFEIFLNHKSAFEKKVSCLNIDESANIDPKLFVEGSNTLSFNVDDGSFIFSDIELRTKSKEADFPSYSFTVSPETYDKIKNNELKLNLQFLLENNQFNKNARLEINNNEYLMRTDTNEFTLDLKEYIIQGTNFLKIIPSNTFNLVALKVVLE
ncbi:MAG: hypothetical protein AABX19_03105 [Nanoarchaeota archaeon]